MAKIKLLTFDLDNTLWSVMEVIQHAEDSLARHLALSFEEYAQRLSVTHLRRFRLQSSQQNPKKAHDLTFLRRDSIRAALEDVGLSPRDASRAADEAFAVFYEARNQIGFFPFVRESLQRLSCSYELAALTNGNADVRRVGLGDVFSFQYSAEVVGKRKPAPEMFHAALSHAGVSEKEAVHIGDHPLEDVGAAQAVGMGSVWANPLGVPWPSELDSPQHSFSDFSELFELVARIDGGD